MASAITKTIRDRVGIITLNKPESRNALDDALIAELSEAVNTFGRSAEVRVIVITGEGAAFCAGMNLGYLERSIAKSVEENVEDARALMRMLLAIHHCRKVVIAMVNGPAMGGGCGLAAACDYVFASKEKAIFGVPEVRLGFVPAVILEFLINRIGTGKTREFVLQGEIADALRAKQYGLATDAIPDAELQDTVFKFAQQLCSSTSSSSVGLTKELMSRFEEMNHKDALEFAANLNAIVRKTDDFKRGMEASVKKEKIQW